MQKQEERIVQGAGRILQYTLVRKPVKNLNMRIKPEGQIWVSAPFGVTANYTDAFVLAHEDFIVKALKKYEKVRENAPKPLQYVSGEQIRYLGEALYLLVETSRKEGADISGNHLILKVRDREDFMRKERIIKKWQQERGQEVFTDICKEIYPLFQDFGVKYPVVKIRAMKSRWGSCQPYKGVITLNARMLAAKREAIEYVVLHEFAHFIYPNHSKDFYGLVETLMPDWKERKAMLQEIS